MEEEFIPYEQALALKELGFDEACFCFYTKNNTILTIVGKPVSYTTALNCKIFKDKLLAPLYQQAIDWFRVNHKIHIHMYYLEETSKWYSDIYKLPKNGLINREVEINGSKYEEVRLEGIKTMIHHIKYIKRKQINNENK
jgi:hypothetical protein